jgi:hypothetical protein
MIGRVGADRPVRVERILAEDCAVALSNSPVHAHGRAPRLTEAWDSAGPIGLRARRSRCRPVVE